MFNRFRFKKGETWLYKLDPRSKLFLTLTITILCLINANLYYQVGLSITIFLIAVSAKFSDEWVKTIKASAPLIIFVGVLNYFYLDLIYSLVISLRLLNLIAIFSIFFLTTPPERLESALRKLRFPDTFNFIFVTGIKYVWILAREANEISDAYKARGISTGRSFFGRARFFLMALIPLVTISIMRSHSLAEALEMRAFGSGKRTMLEEFVMVERDWLVIFLSLLIVGLSLSINYKLFS